MSTDDQSSRGLTSRRGLLQIAAAGSVALLSDATSARARSRRPRLDVDGRVLVPGDAQYAQAVLGFNRTVSHSPVIVVAARSARDVQAAVRYAERRDMPVAVMATGHQASVSIDGGMLVTTREMKATRVDPGARLARVQAGALWGPTVARAAKAGLAPLNGSSPTVGVVGYTVGGGLSPTFGRLRGYAADHVRRIELVTADGRIRTASADRHEELFWAVRGGKGNFGIVTRLEFGLFDIQRLYGGSLLFAGSAAPDVLGRWRDWTASVPEAMSSSIALLRLPPLPSVPEPLRGQLVVSVRISYVGGSSRGAELVKPLRAIGAPLVDTVADIPYGGFAAIHSDPTEPVPVYERTGLLRALPDSAVAKLVELAGKDSPSPLALVEVRHLGGALGRAPAEANAVSQRNAAYTLFMAGIAPPDQSQPVRAYADRLITAMRPWSTGGTYVNFLSSDDATAAQVRTAYAPRTYRQLARVKAQVDPANMFRLTHNIPPASRRA